MVAEELTTPSGHHRERGPLRQRSRDQRIGATLVEAPAIAGERKLMTEVAAEVMAGLAHDRTFGLVVMFGLGGICVEVLNDVAFRVVPLRPGMRAP
jgi:acetate---CoA ligase (ADP-forming)